METWTKVLALSLGGTLGVNARYWLGVWMSRWTSPQFPWATFTINVSGSFLIGFLTVALARWLPHPNLRLLVITGFLGGYTTFSTFENDALILWERGERWLMAANIVGSVALGFVAVVIGTVAARGLAEPKLDGHTAKTRSALEQPEERRASVPYAALGQRKGQEQGAAEPGDPGKPD
jgi:CrcB protein